MLWTAHKVIMQHRAEEQFQGWQITLPGHPVEIQRTERKQEFTPEDAKALLGKVIGIEGGEVTRLFNQQEETLGFMYTVKGIPMGFLMKLLPEAHAQKVA